MYNNSLNKVIEHESLKSNILTLQQKKEGLEKLQKNLSEIRNSCDIHSSKYRHYAALCGDILSACCTLDETIKALQRALVESGYYL